MKPRKFTGTRSRDVLEQVRNELGPDAMIVSNRATADGIEVTALAVAEVETLLEAAGATRRPAAAPASASTATPPAAEEPAVRAWRPPSAEAPVASAAAAEPAPPAERGASESGAWPRLMTEVAGLRRLLEEQLGDLAWSDIMRRRPLAARAQRDLLAAGYSATLAREVVRRMGDGLSPAQARPWLAGVLAKNLRVVADGEDPVSRGGVYALVGPTGVGKTTTVAKLAARCAVRFGASKLALFTTDSYRVGAHDQLRIYARILGVPVRAIADADDLAQALGAAAGKHLVLIDTVGLSQRDRRLADQARILDDPRVTKLVLLNATSQGETLDEVATAYGGSAGERPPVVLTKLDEAARIGPVLDVAIRRRLSVAYVTHGQRVPEDLSLPRADVLADRSLRALPSPGPFTLADDELPLAMPLALGAAHA
ncbi:MAG: flagellar biosynthesis protein FlhF [Burkholderiales bacterium]